MSYAPVEFGTQSKFIGDYTTKGGQLGLHVRVPIAPATLDQLTDFTEICSRYEVEANATTTFTLGVIGTDIAVGYDCFIYNSGTGTLNVNDSGAGLIISIPAGVGYHFNASGVPTTWYLSDLGGGVQIKDNAGTIVNPLSGAIQISEPTNSGITALSGGVGILNLNNLHDLSSFVVDGAGGSRYTTVQSAIDAVRTAGGGTIYVRPGNYVEDLVIDDGAGNPGAYPISIIGITGDGKTNEVAIEGSVSISLSVGFTPPILGNLFSMRDLSIIPQSGKNAINHLNGFASFVNCALICTDPTDIAFNGSVGSTGFGTSIVDNCLINPFGNSTYNASSITDGYQLTFTNGISTGINTAVGALSGSQLVFRAADIGPISLDTFASVVSTATAINGSITMAPTYSGTAVFIGGNINGGTGTFTTTLGNTIRVQAVVGSNYSVNIASTSTGLVEFIGSDITDNNTLTVDGAAINIYNCTVGGINITSGADVNIYSSTTEDINIESSGTGNSTVEIRQSDVRFITVGGSATAGTSLTVIDSSVISYNLSALPTYRIYGGFSNVITTSGDINIHFHFTNASMVVNVGNVNLFNSVLANPPSFVNGTIIAKNCTFQDSVTVPNAVQFTAYNCDFTNFTQSSTSPCALHNCTITGELAQINGNMVIHSCIIEDGKADFNGAGTEIRISNSYMNQISQGAANTMYIFGGRLTIFTDIIGSVTYISNTFMESGATTPLSISGTCNCFNSIMDSTSANWAAGTGTLNQRGNILFNNAATNTVATTNLDLTTAGVYSALTVLPAFRMT